VDSGTLLRFAQANDAAAATTKKLQKQAILAEYFQSLDETDLRLAVRYAAGRVFAATDERVLNVGGALVSEVTLAIVQMEPDAYHDLVVRSGEIGEGISQVWPTPQDVNTNLPLRLTDLAHSFDDLATTGVWENKRTLLLDLLLRCTSGREAAYVTKIIFGDLRTGVQEGVLQGALARAFAKPLADIQRCQLLVGDLDEVAVLAKNDALAVATFRLFHPIQFMLATPQETPEDAEKTLGGRSFFVEDKLDGIRAQVHKSGEGASARIAIYTRTMDRTEDSFPDVVAALSKIPGEFLLDGEIVPYSAGQVLPFAHIQKRLGRKVLTPAVLRDNPAAFIAFDILLHNGELLMDCPLARRREALASLCSSSGCELLTTALSQATTASEISAAFDAARARRNEGIVLKDPQSIYSPGRRGKWWLKIKTHLPTLDCVVTAAEYGHGKRRSVLSDYTFAVWTEDPANPESQLVNVGKAYSGVTDEEIRQLTDTFLQLSRRQFGRVHVVEPKIVLEIAFDQIQKSDRHASGYALRFPRIKRIRRDKRIEDADRLSRVIEIYQSLANTAKQPGESPAPAPEPTLFDGMD
jgi:DNA ligase-1